MLLVVTLREVSMRKIIDGASFNSIKLFDLNLPREVIMQAGCIVLVDRDMVRVLKNRHSYLSDQYIKEFALKYFNTQPHLPDSLLAPFPDDADNSNKVNDGRTLE